MIPPVGSVLPPTPTRLAAGVGGIGPTGGRSSRSCDGSRHGVSSIRWTTTSPAARGGARSTRTSCATPSKRSCSSSVATGSRHGRSVARWVNFFNAPSAQSWYGAHNASVVAGYLAHAALAALEAPAERFFMNVVLVRVLYAHALVLDGDLALGRLSFLARLIGHPRSRGPQALLSMKDVLPDRYPIQGAGIEELIDSENRLGRMVDYGVIGVRVDALYATSARALGEPLLLDLIADGAPAYAWPADQRHVWEPQSQRRFTSLIEFLTRPRAFRHPGDRTTVDKNAP